MTERHFVSEVSFSQNWILCSCGTRVPDAIVRKDDLASRAYQLHQKEAGQAKVQESNRLREGVPYGRSRNWNGRYDEETTPEAGERV